MDRFVVIGDCVSLVSGILELTPAQAASRKHSLDSLGDDLYQISAPVQFKRGETFGYDGEADKRLTEKLQRKAPAVPSRRKGA